MASPPEALRCVRHPDRETYVRCSTCGDPVCPRCMIQAPVGIRCPRCVRYERNPLVHVRTGLLARGVGAGIITAAGLGGLLGFLAPLFGFLSLLAWAGAGYLIGQAVAIASNRSRARAIQWVAGTSAFLAFVVAAVINTPFALSLYGAFAAILSIGVAISSVMR